MNELVQQGIPANEGPRFVVGNARLTGDELTAILIRAGHPDPNVARAWLMNGTSRQTIIPRTAQDSLNEMELSEIKSEVAVLTRALRIRLSPLQVRMLDLASGWIGSESAAKALSVSQQQAQNILSKLQDLGLLERKTAQDGRIRLYRTLAGSQRESS